MLLVRACALVVLTCALLVAGPAAGQATKELRITAHDEGPPDMQGERAFWFEVDGLEGRNPEMVLQPGEVVHVVLVNRGSVAHNILFGGPIQEQTPLAEPNATAELDFTVAANATGGATYLCVPHQVVGMRGALGIGGPVPPEAGGVPPLRRQYLVPGAPALASALAGAALAFLARRRGA